MVEFDGYSQVHKVGEGGLGNVYRAVRNSTGGTVAIKELRDVGVGSPIWHRARRELEALLRLKGHPYVVSVEEIIEGPSGPCLVMEYVSGGSLADRLQHGALSGPELVLVGQHVSQALTAGHDLGIVHRDVKPHNLLIGSFGQVKVCDFGIAALTRGNEVHTQTQALSLAYASPEEIDGVDVIGPAADAYSFGATFLHLARGRRPTLKDRMAPDISAQLLALHDDPALAQVFESVASCLVHDADERPTMSDVSAVFDDAAAALGRRRLQRFAQASTDQGVSTPPDPPPTMSAEPTRLRGAEHFGRTTSDAAKDASLAYRAHETQHSIEVRQTYSAAAQTPTTSKPSKNLGGRRVPVMVGGAAVAACLAIVGVVALAGANHSAGLPSSTVTTDKAATLNSAAMPPPTSPTAVPTSAALSSETTSPPASEARVGSELVGMKGTIPLVELSNDFARRVLSTPSGSADGGLTDFNYAGETYDAIINIALAAEVAGTDGSAMADQIVGVTKDGDKCTSFADCLAIIKAGGDPDYDGHSGPITMNGNGEPLEASCGVLVFGAGNQLDDSLTTFITASAPESAVKPLQTTDVAREGDGVLAFGGLLPQTGSLAFLGAPMFAGAELAIADINAAGGVLGKPVTWSPGNSGDTSSDIASVTADRLLREGVDAIIGAASSSVSFTVIDKITAAGVVQYSPANTSLKLVDYPDHALYFRNAPPDDLQGNVIAQLVIDDGNQSAFILALDDAYGTSLADVVEAGLTAAGVEVLGKKIYDPKATSFDAEVDEVAAADPDAIILITFDEGSRILKTMVEKGVGPQDKMVYGCDGNMGNALGDNFNAGK